jgi:signal transduction histidine kinase
MSRPLPLRKRVALWFAALGLFLCGLFAIATLAIAEGFEHILVGELLDDAAATRFETQAQSRYFRVYAASETPEAYRDLPVGVHELDDGAHAGLHVGVYEQSGRRVLVVMELGEIERLERYLAAVLALIVVGGGALAGLLGWAFSSGAIRPVRILASGLASLPGRPVPTRFAQANRDDVLGPIAAAIDGYVQRLADADASEKRFYADASHELRTPITVIQGAAEILRDDPQTSDAQRVRLARIERAAADLAVMLDAILLAARTVPVERERVSLDELVDAAMERISLAIPDARDRVSVASDPSAEVEAPRRWADALVDVLLLRILARPAGGAWRIDVRTDGVDLSAEEPSNIEALAFDDRADLGISLRFAERLAASFGWTVTSHRRTAGLTIAIRVGATPSSAGVAG